MTTHTLEEANPTVRATRAAAITPSRASTALHHRSRIPIMLHHSSMELRPSTAPLHRIRTVHRLIRMEEHSNSLPNWTMMTEICRSEEA